MNSRNEAKQKVDGFKTINDDGYSFEKEDIKDLVDEIYDEVKSRVCTNCIHCDGKQLGSFYCPELNYWVEPENFGCTEFKRKEL